MVVQNPTSSELDTKMRVFFHKSKTAIGNQMEKQTEITQTGHLNLLVKFNPGTIFYSTLHSFASVHTRFESAQEAVQSFHLTMAKVSVFKHWLSTLMLVTTL